MTEALYTVQITVTRNTDRTILYSRNDSASYFEVGSVENEGDTQFIEWAVVDPEEIRYAQEKQRWENAQKRYYRHKKALQVSTQELIAEDALPLIKTDKDQL